MSRCSKGLGSYAWHAYCAIVRSCTLKNVAIGSAGAVIGYNVNAFVRAEYDVKRNNSYNSHLCALGPVPSYSFDADIEARPIKKSWFDTAKEFKFFPSVEASTMVSQAVPRPQEVMPRKSSSSEVSKHGFPTFENLRVFGDYVLAYDRRTRTPLWVLEHLTRDKIKKAADVKRDDSKFLPDEKIHPYFRAANDDFKKSGYDRGHLAAAGNHKWSQTAMDETFYLSNIAPQVGPGFNRDAWNQLERYLRYLTKFYPNIYICSGPLYLPKMESDGRQYVKYEVIGQSQVAVPTHFFKVVIAETPSGDLEQFAVIMPNAVLPDPVNLDDYLVPIDTIERAAGFLIFSGISKAKVKPLTKLPHLRMLK